MVHFICSNGNQYFFNCERDLVNYFLMESNYLFDAYKNNFKVELLEYQKKELSRIKNTFVQDYNLEINTNLQLIYNFDTMSKSKNFIKTVDEFITHLKIEVNDVDDVVLSLFKKRLVRKSTTLPNLLVALELDDNVLSFLIQKRIMELT